MAILTVSEDNVNQGAGWGQFDVSEGSTFRWRMGELTLSAFRTSSEWQIGYHHEEDKTKASPATPLSLDDSLQTGSASNIDRYLLGKTDQILRLVPVLADRSVVSRPIAPLHLMAGGEIHIYVRTPLWIRVEVGEPPKVLQEIPAVRLSDSWFGPNTIQGEMCYASRTFARLTMADVPSRSDLAVTRVLIRNNSGRTTTFEQLSLPVPYLALFASKNDILWTQGVTLTSARNGKTVEVKVGDGAPVVADNAKRLSEPRQMLERNTLTKGWSLIFG